MSAAHLENVNNARVQQGRGDKSVKIRVRVDPSRIAGQGLFAAQAITQGTRIVQYLGERIPTDEGARRLAQGNAYIFELSARIDIDGKTLTNTARYINHSCDPNCDIALRREA